MGILSAAPTDPEEQYAQVLASYERRIADLERSLGRFRGGAGAPAGTGTKGQEYWDTTNNRLYRSDGTGWIVMLEPEQAYSPTTTGVTFGSGGSGSGAYQRSGGWCDYTVIYNMGSGTAGSLGTGPTWTVPKAIRTGDVSSVMLGNATFYDASGPIYSAVIIGLTGTTIEPRTPNALGANQQWTAALPAAVGVNDVIHLKLRYRMNTLYL